MVIKSDKSNKDQKVKTFCHLEHFSSNFDDDVHLVMKKWKNSEDCEKTARLARKKEMMKVIISVFRFLLSKYIVV